MKVNRVFGLMTMLLGSALANAQYNPYFLSVGALPTDANQSVAYGLADNGSVVVGYTGSISQNTTDAFRWTPSGGIANIYNSNANIYGTKATGVAADGNSISGSCITEAGGQAFRWTSSGGLVTIGDLPGGGFYSEGNGISGDGSTVVGYSESANGNEAFRWTASGGMQGLGDLPGGSFRSVARGVSADGSVVVGYSQTTDGSYSVNEAFRWTATTGMVALGTLPGGPIFSDAFGISGDGRTIVGLAKTTSLQYSAMKWTAETGMVKIGTGGGGIAYAASYDGSVIVGSQSNGSFEEAFIYDDVNGFQWLRQLLVSKGLGSELSGWTLTRATGVTVTSQGVPIITGFGTDGNGHQHGFVAAVPEPASMIGLLSGAIVFLRRRRNKKVE